MREWNEQRNRGNDLRPPMKSFIKEPAFELLAGARECQRSGVAVTGSGAVPYRMSRCNSHPFERTRPCMMNDDVHCSIVGECRSINVVADGRPALRRLRVRRASNLPAQLPKKYSNVSKSGRFCQ